MSSYAQAESAPMFFWEEEMNRATWDAFWGKRKAQINGAVDEAFEMFCSFTDKIGMSRRGVLITALAGLVVGGVIANQDRYSTRPVNLEPAQRTREAADISRPTLPAEVDPSLVVPLSRAVHATSSRAPVSRVESRASEYAPQRNDAASAYLVDSGNGYNLTFAQSGELVRVYPTGAVEKFADFSNLNIRQSVW
jgi:hypothetical protein